jgi:LemA protein
VKGYAAHESGVFDDVAKARSNVDSLAEAGKKVDPAQLNEVANNFTGALSRLMAVAENYPELKANQNFSQLQDTIEHTENSLEQARRYFNGVVREYNTKRQVFPNVIFAGLFGFKEIDFFGDEKADEMAKGLGTTDVKVEF